jgi:hypothetical protein
VALLAGKRMNPSKPAFGVREGFKDMDPKARSDVMWFASFADESGWKYRRPDAPCAALCLAPRASAGPGLRDTMAPTEPEQVLSATPAPCKIADVRRCASNSPPAGPLYQRPPKLSLRRPGLSPDESYGGSCSPCGHGESAITVSPR